MRDIQAQLPRARIVYCSATGASGAQQRGRRSGECVVGGGRAGGRDGAACWHCRQPAATKRSPHRTHAHTLLQSRATWGTWFVWAYGARATPPLTTFHASWMLSRCGRTRRRARVSLWGTLAGGDAGAALCQASTLHAPPRGPHPASRRLPPQSKGSAGSAGSVAALELVAMDMKAQGMFVCRTLSFAGERGSAAAAACGLPGAGGQGRGSSSAPAAAAAGVAHGWVWAEGACQYAARAPCAEPPPCSRAGAEFETIEAPMEEPVRSQYVRAAAMWNQLFREFLYAEEQAQQVCVWGG